MSANVIAVSAAAGHVFSKENLSEIELLEGLGVKGDAHMGKTVKHRSRVKKDPTVPNLRQVHLIHEELIDELRDNGFDVVPGGMGENVTTRGIDLLGLPAGARLTLGDEAVVEVTGLRNPCNQLNDYRGGLMNAVLDKDEKGDLIRKSGVMAIVIAGGVVRPGDVIGIETPAEPHRALDVV